MLVMMITIATEKDVIITNLLIEYAEGAVRLISSSYSSLNTSPGGSAGRLEIYYNRVWGTICNTGFSQTDANVVCQQLGYSKAYRYGSVANLG